jgi:hypothetical protein
LGIYRDIIKKKKERKKKQEDIEKKYRSIYIEVAKLLDSLIMANPETLNNN